MEKRRVVVTGLGTVNPIGLNAAETWANARAGVCGIGPITRFDTTDFKVKLAGEVKNFDPETVIDRREAKKMARFTQMAVAAADEAMKDSGLAIEKDDPALGTLRHHPLQRHRQPAHHRGGAQPRPGQGL